MIAPFPHRTGVAQTQRLVAEAIARYMPELAAQQRDRAAEQRYFTIDHTQVSFAGTSRVHGELDLADALDLEEAIAAGAAQLAALGNTEPLDVRRSLAAGMLARGDQPLTLPATDPAAAPAPEAEPVRTPAGRLPRRRPGREVVLYVHLSEDAIASSD